MSHAGNTKTQPAVRRGEHWGIVGGGILGLSLALALARRGRRVTVLEAADHPGGVADAWSLGEVRWDRHYHVICQSDEHLRGLLRRLDLEREIDWVTTRTGFYGPDQRLVSISDNLDILRNLPFGLLSKLRLAATIFYASRCRDGERLEQIPVSDWLLRLSGRRVFNGLWLPLLRAKLGESYRITSAAFIWAVIQRLSRARQMGLDKERFGYVPGGFGRVLERFSTALDTAGVTLRCGCPAQRVDNVDGRVVVTAGGEHHRFDRVALTVPSPIVSRLCPGLGAGERRGLEGITYQGLVCASLLLDEPLADYYLTYITDTGVPFTAVVEMSNLIDSGRHLGGRHLVYLPKYVPPTDPLLEADDATIEESFLGALEAMYPGFHRSGVRCFRISRVRYLLPLSTLHYSRHLPPMQTSLAGVHVINSSHIRNGTLNLDETVRLAEEAAARLAVDPAADETSQGAESHGAER